MIELLLFCNVLILYVYLKVLIVLWWRYFPHQTKTDYSNPV